jgi:hypothetical protein
MRSLLFVDDEPPILADLVPAPAFLCQPSSFDKNFSEAHAASRINP